MKAKDLRIGNLIYVKCIAKEVGYDDFNVQECNIHNIKGVLEGNEDFLYKPIPLTEEWLLNFGWELDHTSNDLKSFINYKLDLDAINFSPSRNEFYYNCWEDSKCPKYVHELQNVYFALTGEELTLIEKS